MKLHNYSTRHTPGTQKPLPVYLNFSAGELFRQRDSIISGKNPLLNKVLTEPQVLTVKLEYDKLCARNQKLLASMHSDGLNQEQLDEFKTNSIKHTELQYMLNKHEQRISAVNKAEIQFSTAFTKTINKNTTMNNLVCQIDNLRTGDKLLNENGHINNQDYQNNSSYNYPKLNNKFHCNDNLKKKIQNAVNKKMQSSTSTATVALEKLTYAAIVKKHEPNLHNPVPLHNWRLSPMTKKNKENNKVKLPRKRVNNNSKDRIVISTMTTSFNNETANNLDSTMELNTSTSSNANTEAETTVPETNNDSWTVVSLKTYNEIDKSLPKTFLQVTSPSLYDTDATYVYGIRIIMTPPKNKGISVVNPQIFTSKLLSTLQYVCNNTAILSCDESTQPPLTDPTKALGYDTATVNKYLKTYTTTNPTFVCYVRLHSDITLQQFKKNKEFVTWLKTENIITEPSILNGEYAEPIGFFIKKNTTEELLTLQTTRIRSNLPSTVNNKFDVCNMWIRSNSTLSTKVLMVKAQSTDEALLLEQIDHCYNKGMGGYVFFPYKAFKRATPEKKETIIREQIEFNKNNRSILLHGFVNFDYNTKVYDQQAKEPIPKRKLNEDNPDQSTISDTTMSYENMSVIDFMGTQFLDNNGNSIVKRASCPISNTIELLIPSEHYYKFKTVKNSDILNSLGSVIPPHRHQLIFQNPSSISAGIPPNALFVNNLINKYDRMFDTIDGTKYNNTTPIPTKHKKVAKIVVHNNVDDIKVRNEPRGRTNDATMQGNNNKDHNNTKPTQKDQDPNVLSIETINKFMSDLKTEFHNNLTKVKECINNDANKVLNMMEKMEKMDKEIQQQKADASNMDVVLRQHVQTAVQQEITSQLSTFNDTLNSKFQQVFQSLDSKSEERIALLMDEQQALKQEYRETRATTTTQFEQIMLMFQQQRNEAALQEQIRPSMTSQNNCEPTRGTQRILHTRNTRNNTTSTQGTQHTSLFDSGAIKSCLNKLNSNLNE
jgi:hypothetical protein